MTGCKAVASKAKTESSRESFTPLVGPLSLDASGSRILLRDELHSPLKFLVTSSNVTTGPRSCPLSHVEQYGGESLAIACLHR